jgi:hypothetical protein
MSKKDAQAPISFPEKWSKVIEKLPEFKDTADAASPDDLKKIIVTCEGNIYTIDAAKASDIKLNGAKELVKEYSEPYNDALKVQTAKVKYALFLLEGKGIDVGDQ